MSDPHRTNARRAYAMLAERYDAMAPTKPHNALYERPASLELLGSVDGLTVLDAACGTGIVTEMLARSAAKIHAFDITPEMLALARKRCAGLDVDFREADLAMPLAWWPTPASTASCARLRLIISKPSLLFSPNSIASPGPAAGLCFP